MFVGTYEHALDGKGRVVLPSKFRNRLAQAGYLAPNDGCVALWPADEFDQMVDRVRERVRAGEDGPNILRGLASYSEEVTPDAQGRIIIPALLREFADLGPEVVVTGSFDHVEIWNLERWADLRPDLDETILRAVADGAGA